MTAVLLVARCDLRRRRRSALALTVMLGLVGAVVLGSAAGAHRSGTALSRFISYSRASDAEVDVTGPTAAQLRAFGRLPEVVDFAELHAYALSPAGRPELRNAATIDGRLGTAVDRARVISGRAPNPRAVDEIAIGEGLAAQEHLGIGDHLDAASITPAQLAQLNEGTQLGVPRGPHVRLRVVGIVRRPLDLGDLAAAGGVVIETPAFDRAYEKRMAIFTTVLRVRARHGTADDARLSADSRRVFGRGFSSVSDVSDEAHGGQDAIGALTFALWLFAGVAALAGAVAIAIVLSRDLSRSGADQEALAALGLTRRQRTATVALRAVPVAVGGAVIATALAIAASPMFPIGIARRAEPAPGFRVDGPVLGLGFVAIVAFAALVAFVSARRATLPSAGASTAARSRSRSRPTLAAVVARAGVRPSVTNGLRLAFEPGNGKDALPVRSALAGAAFSVVALTAVVVFAASLGHLDSTPHLYGWTWDFKAPDNSHVDPCDARDFGLASKPGVAAVAAICYQDVQVDGRPTVGWGFTPVRGAIEPEIVAGRPPSAPDEVALGTTTLHGTGKHIGDSVRVRGEKGAREYRIVGRVALPQLSEGDEQPLASGAVFTGQGFSPILDTGSSTRYLVGDFAPGANPRAVLRAVDAIPEFQAPTQRGAFASNVGAARASRPPEVARIRAINWLPALLAALIAVLALVAVGHALVTTTHRRRAELALLKTFGFSRRQVRATLAWQATALMVAGVVVGIPVGVAAGNVVWRRVAGSLGISPVVVVPVSVLAIGVPCAIAVVLLVGSIPARIAARGRPAEALRAE